MTGALLWTWINSVHWLNQTDLYLGNNFVSDGRTRLQHFLSCAAITSDCMIKKIVGLFCHTYVCLFALFLFTFIFYFFPIFWFLGSISDGHFLKFLPIFVLVLSQPSLNTLHRRSNLRVRWQNSSVSAVCEFDTWHISISSQHILTVFLFVLESLFDTKCFQPLRVVNIMMKTLRGKMPGLMKILNQSTEHVAAFSRHHTTTSFLHCDENEPDTS